jgi:hypothetical protein
LNTGRFRQIEPVSIEPITQRWIVGEIPDSRQVSGRRDPSHQGRVARPFDQIRHRAPNAMLVHEHRRPPAEHPVVTREQTSLAVRDEVGDAAGARRPLPLIERGEISPGKHRLGAFEVTADPFDLLDPRLDRWPMAECEGGHP